MNRLVRPYISYAEVKEDFEKIFETGIFTKGPYCAKLIEQLKLYTGAPYAFLTTSATTALSTCLKVLNIGKGDWVAVSDFSFPASSNVIEDLGATPIFIDVSGDTFNMNPDKLENIEVSRLKAIVYVDAFGNLSGIDRIRDFAQKRGIPLIEDAACAMGSSISGIKAGNIADFTCFSFHPRKVITSGEGGAITLKNTQWAEKLAVKLSHGSTGVGIDTQFVDYGFNFRMTEIQAAMILPQLGQIDSIVDRRLKIWKMYIAGLTPLGFVPQFIAPDVRFNVQSLVFVVPKNVIRNDLVRFLATRGIEATLGTYSLSSTEYYQSKYKMSQPMSKKLQNETITLPCHDEVNLDKIIETIKLFCEAL